MNQIEYSDVTAAGLCDGCSGQLTEFVKRLPEDGWSFFLGKCWAELFCIDKNGQTMNMQGYGFVIEVTQNIL